MPIHQPPLRTALRSIPFAVLVACTGPTGPGPTAGKPASHDTASARTARALFVGIDGLRPDAMVAASTPHLDRLQSEGAWSLAAATQQTGATSSAPGWTSIFTGVEVSVHGVEANGDYDGYDRTLPTFARLARTTLGRTTRAAAHWPEVLSDIHAPDDFDDSLLTNDDGVATTTAEAIAAGTHHLHVLHLDDVDHAGHATGFSADNPDYLAAIEAQDARLGTLLAAIDARSATDDWLVVVTTDHGGEDTDHGAQTTACQTIPLVVWGGGVQPGELATDPAPSHLDAFPTILAHLGATAAQLGPTSGQARVPLAD